MRVWSKNECIVIIIVTCSKILSFATVLILAMVVSSEGNGIHSLECLDKQESFPSGKRGFVCICGQCKLTGFLQKFDSLVILIDSLSVYSLESGLWNISLAWTLLTKVSIYGRINRSLLKTDNRLQNLL